MQLLFFCIRPFDSSFLKSGDCDDGAGFTNQVIMQCKAHNNSELYPNMRAVANSIGAHYVHGVAVLAANAGHADAADDSKTKIAGHALLLLTPKDSFAVGMARGARAKLKGNYVIDPAYENAVTNERWAQLYPKELVERMPAAERPLVESYEAARKFVANNTTSKLQPLAVEPTTFASATLYKHDDHERVERQQTFLKNKKSMVRIHAACLCTSCAPQENVHFGSHAAHAPFVHLRRMCTSGRMQLMHLLWTSGECALRVACSSCTFCGPQEKISPNQLRMYSNLDVGATGEHAFYSQFVENSFSLGDGLFVSAPLRSMGAACCHVRHVQVSASNDIVSAGASPKDLATGEYALLPLWTVGVAEGAIIDEAHAESLTNSMPMRGSPVVFDDAVLNTNLETLRGIHAFLTQEGKSELPKSTLHQGVVSFASLVGNAHALEDFAKTLKANPNITGEVFGLDDIVEGVAVNSKGEQLGRFVMLELELPA